MTGVCTAPFVGRSVDRIVPWSGVVLGNLLLIVSNVLLLGGAQTNVAFIIFAIFILDVGQQFQQVNCISLPLSIFREHILITEWNRFPIKVESSAQILKQALA